MSEANKKVESAFEPALWNWMSDDPLENLSDDPRSRFFDRSAFITTIGEAMARARVQSKSSVFGLVGDWGAGKSTIVATLSRQLTHSGWTVQHFNPWLYPDADSLNWGFFSELRSIIPKGDQWSDTRKTLDRLRKAVVPIAKVASAFGPDASGVAETLLDPAQLSVTKMRKRVSEQLNGLQNPVLIVLDDLDRLTADELLETFKLVRFIGRLPNVYYLLCYDEKTLLDLLEKTDLVGERNDRRAIDYLEKIVQIRFDVPPLRTDLVQTLFEMSLRGIVEKCGISLTASDEKRLIELLEIGLVERLTTPRSVRHLFAHLEALLPSVANEVDTVDFVLLSWIRTFEPGLFRLIQTNRAFLMSGSGQIESDRAREKERRLDQLNQLLNDAKVLTQNRSSLTDVLAALFPVVGRIARKQQLDHLPSHGSQRISDGFYFDRYFILGVPSDDISDLSVRQALAAIYSGNKVEELLQLEEQLAINAGRAIQKIKQEHVSISANTEPLIRWVISQFSTLPIQNGWFAPRDLLTRMLAELLVEVDVRGVPGLLASATEDGVGPAYMFLDASGMLLARQYGDQNEIERWARRGSEIAEVLKERLPPFISETTAKDVFELERYEWLLLIRWCEFDSAGPQHLFRQRIESGLWPALDVVARMVSSVVPSGSGPDAVSSISGFDPIWVSKFIDLSALRQELIPSIEGAGEVFELDRAEATPENRRAYALAWLKANKGDEGWGSGASTE